MKMFRCKDCSREFDEPATQRTTYENYYGVSDLFSNRTTLYITTCPYCESEYFEEFDDEEGDEEDGEE